MGYIGNRPTAVPLTSADIQDGVITAADLGANSVDSSELVNGSVDLGHLSASGTASSSTFLRGDNSWVAAGGGKILQMQHMTTNSLQTFSSSTYADSAITDTITCSSSSNSVMVMLSLNLTKGSGTTTGAVRINEIVGESVTDTRNITDIWGWNQTTFGGQIGYNWISTPATTSAVTYTVQLASEQDVAHIQTNNYQASDNRAVSTLILMEIDGT